MKRINFNVPEQTHNHLKAMAARRGISLKEMFIKAAYAWLKMNTLANKES